MQLGTPGGRIASATTLAEGLRLATAERGHRPAITVLGAGAQRERRDEQAFASLHQWVAKGAHLLEVDGGLEPGDGLLLDAPPGWMAASICLAAWWVGAFVTDDPSQALAAVAHASRVRGSTTWVIGDEPDGAPSHEVGAASWASAVQSFPDQPPAARATAEAIAVRAASHSLTQAELLASARALPSGRLGIHDTADLGSWATPLAARPAATGAPAILVVSAAAADVAAERIDHWA